MAGDDGEDHCDFCKTGHLNWRKEEMAFRQSSDKGEVRCRVSLLVSTCDRCGSKTLEPDSDDVLAAAFRRAYDEL